MDQESASTISTKPTTTFSNDNHSFLIGAFIGYATKTISYSIFQLLFFGTSRPSRDVVTDMGVNIIRKYLAFDFAKLSHVRTAIKGIGLINPKPSGSTVSQFKFTIKTKYILDLEQQGKAFLNRSTFSQYPIPEEVESNHKLVLSGHWIMPWKNPNGDQKSSWNDSIKGWFSLENLKPKKIQSFFSLYRLNQTRKVILYLHGGAYILGDAGLYTSLNGSMAKATGFPVITVNYRLAPEYPFPCALHDALATYLWLINPKSPALDETDQPLHEPYDPKDIIIAGDSAGGGLCCALLNYLNLYLRNERGGLILPMPKCAVLFSVRLINQAMD